MKNSSYGYYGSTAAASSFDDDLVFGGGGAPAVGSRYVAGPISRGMQLEAAVEKLPGWYFGDDDIDGESERWHERNGIPLSSGGGRSSGSTGRTRRSQHYLDDSMDLLGSVSEVANPDDDEGTGGGYAANNRSNSDEDDEDDAENKYYNSNSMQKSRSIRSSYLLDSPESTTKTKKSNNNHDFEPQSNSTTTSTLDAEHEKLSFIVHDHDGAKSSTNQKSHLDTSPQSHKGGVTPMGRQHRLSSRRSTLSSSCTCTDLVVTRYTMGGREKKVMYHIDVVNHESQLQTYTIRRSYTDFKVLHNDLSAVLEARKEYYMSRAQLRHESKERRSLSTAPTTGYSSSSFMNNSSLRAQHSLSPEDVLEASVMAFNLPTLPHAGLMSFWRRHDHSHLKHRCEVFQEILRAILKMPFLRESLAMQKFLSTAPCAIRDRGSSYVSLSEYSVPHIDLDEEHRERRRRAQEHRRNSSVTSASMSMYEY